jgi:heme/copper-type cytochrome/quinol oxidase subunit 2
VTKASDIARQRLYNRAVILAIGKDWWLPTNYAVHGREIDSLFLWFFWITLAVFVAVHVLLVVFVWKYRATAKNKRARHLHGNRRVEIIWTVIPGLILTGLAVGSEKVWHDFRNSPDNSNPERAKILIIGQQFKWNVIYPGPDGKFGRYLVYPKPADPLWPAGADGRPIRFANVPGPASLPFKDAIKAINTYIDSENPLGKDFADPDGKDDNWSFAPGRPVFVPVNRPVEVLLESKDVIHDFFIPNFRAQLYAVPGMRGSFVFTPTITTAELEAGSRETVRLEELASRLTHADANAWVIDINAGSPGAVQDKTGWRYASGLGRKAVTIIRDQMAFAPMVVDRLRAIGINQVTIHRHQPFEIACAQLCGAQHYTMRGELIVLSQAEFDKRFPALPHLGG